jgi:hypothetical protein
MVYLVKKKPVSELRPEEVIPPEIDGVKTHVIESGVFRLCAEDLDDLDQYRPLVGGCMIDAGGFTFLKAHALILEPKHPFFVVDRIVSRAGVQVNRYFRRARSWDGSTFVWMGRKSEPGRGPRLVRPAF